VLVLVERCKDKELARINCASAAGRRTLLKFLHDWGKAARYKAEAESHCRKSGSNFWSRTESLSQMLNTPQLSFFFKDYNDPESPLRNDDPFSECVRHFMQGDPLDGMAELGMVFPRLLQFGTAKGSSPQYGTLFVSCVFGIAKSRADSTRQRNASFERLRFYFDGPEKVYTLYQETVTRILVIMDKRKRREVARMNCASAAGRRELIHFLHDWGKKYDVMRGTQRKESAKKSAQETREVGNKLLKLSINNARNMASRKTSLNNDPVVLIPVSNPSTPFSTDVLMFNTTGHDEVRRCLETTMENHT